MIKDVLGDNVEKVIVPDRVVDSPCCLVTGEYGPGGLPTWKEL